MSRDPESVVLETIELVFGRRQVQEAAMKYVAEDFVQHSPEWPTGRDAWVAMISEVLERMPTAEFTVKRVIAKDDLVVTHSHMKPTKDDRGFAVADIFRIVDGRIAEHWDVIQPVPEQAMNSNTMF
jgi:predicted SnoaL-like aldol condensation-catalyzing enzyme